MRRSSVWRSLLISLFGFLCVVALVVIGSGGRLTPAPATGRIAQSYPLLPTLPTAGMVTYPGPTKTPNYTLGGPPAPTPPPRPTGLGQNGHFPSPSELMQQREPTPPPPTPTFGPLPTSPTVIPTDFPTPSALPTGLPRPGLIVEAEDRNTTADDVHYAALVVRARIVRIDPPFFMTTNQTRPTGVIDYQNVATPALLHVEHVYKGPAVSDIAVAIGGACFGPNSCTTFFTEWAWQDLVGYDLILFLGAPYQGAPYMVQHNYYWPFRTFIIDSTNPSQALVIEGPLHGIVQVPALEARIRAAPGVNPGA